VPRAAIVILVIAACSDPRAAARDTGL